MSAARRVARHPLVIALAAAGAAASVALVVQRVWLASQPQGDVAIGRTFHGAFERADGPLSPGQPLRAVLSLDEAIGYDGILDVELHRRDPRGEERLERSWAIQVRSTYDEVYFGSPDVARMVGSHDGQFRLAFVRDGRLLGEGRFSVASEAR